MGGYTEEYSGGEFTNMADAWLGQRGGLRTGDPDARRAGHSTPPWVITLEDEREGTAAEVVETGASECVEFACYEDVLVVREGEIGAPGQRVQVLRPRRRADPQLAPPGQPAQGP